LDKINVYIISISLLVDERFRNAWNKVIAIIEKKPLTNVDIHRRYIYQKIKLMIGNINVQMFKIKKII